MSREDPQFKLRMPIELRSLAEKAARAAGRSLNAELVARVEASFLGNSSSDELMPASRARELALMSRSGIPAEIRKRVIDAIAKAVRLGHSQAYVGLTDLHLDEGIPDEDLEELQKDALKELKAAGYQAKWEDITTISIEF